MGRITEIRLTLAAFLYGIEIDIKNVLKKYVTPYYEDINFFQDSELIGKIIDRYKKDNPGVDYKNNIDDVIDYLDFFDSFNVLKSGPREPTMHNFCSL